MRLLFIASGLRLGGAEVVLLELLRHLDRRVFAPTVISLTGGGDIADRIAALDVPVITLDMRRQPLGAFSSLVRQVRALRPDVVQTWMYHGDLFGSLAARLAGVRRIVWGLHNSTLSAASSRRSTHLVRRACVWLSHRVPRRIVSCSVVARDVHLEIGYASAPFVVIGNGFDVERFRPAPAARAELRAELGLAPDTPVVLAVGRDDPQKDHPNFVRAAAIVHAVQPSVHFVMAGTGLTPDHARIGALAWERGVSPVLHLLGPRHDVPQLMAAADLVVLASAYGEAFPLVIGEAMACGVPVVATDVGDSRLLVADCGRIVPPANPESLAQAVLELLALDESERAALGLRARARIEQHYEIGHITRRYEDVYRSVEREGRPCAD